LADICTKALDRIKLNKMCSKMGLEWKSHWRTLVICSLLCFCWGRIILSVRMNETVGQSNPSVMWDVWIYMYAWSMWWVIESLHCVVHFVMFM
jgi:hypothetical protein